MLLKPEGTAEEGDVVIGRQQSDQTKGEAAKCLGETGAVETEVAKAASALWVLRAVWRKRRRFALLDWTIRPGDGGSHRVLAASLAGKAPPTQCHLLAQPLRHLFSAEWPQTPATPRSRWKP